MSISNYCLSKRIQYTSAKSCGLGVRIVVPTAADFKALRTYLSDKDIQYHCYSLPEERSTRVIFRHIHPLISCDDIKADLEAKGFHPTSIFRLRTPRTKQPMHLVRVDFPLTDIGVMDVTRLCDLVTVAEKPRSKAQVSQCHRCQKFRHASSNCNANPRCVKCAGPHLSKDCTRANHCPDSPPVCANCAGNHTANYRGCKMFPLPNGKSGKKDSNPRVRNPPTSTQAPNPVANLPVQAPGLVQVPPEVLQNFLVWARIHHPSNLNCNGN